MPKPSARSAYHVPKSKGGLRNRTQWTDLRLNEIG
ncbi:hypothetical protein V6Z11_A09G197300 [Gossypium hirsutum]